MILQICGKNLLKNTLKSNKVAPFITIILLDKYYYEAFHRIMNSLLVCGYLRPFYIYIIFAGRRRSQKINIKFTQKNY